MLFLIFLLTKLYHSLLTKQTPQQGVILLELASVIARQDVNFSCKHKASCPSCIITVIQWQLHRQLCILQWRLYIQSSSYFYNAEATIKRYSTIRDHKNCDKILDKCVKKLIFSKFADWMSANNKLLHGCLSWFLIK